MVRNPPAALHKISLIALPESGASVLYGLYDVLSSVGKALTMKRIRARARGRAARVVKPFSRLRIVVREVEEAA